MGFHVSPVGPPIFAEWELTNHSTKTTLPAARTFSESAASKKIILNVPAAKTDVIGFKLTYWDFAEK